MSVNTKLCFVIMPFSATKKHTIKYWNHHFNFFLKPLIESCNIEARRSTPLHQDIVRQIVHDLVFSKIVVADLTENNPNVYWELGVRMSFRHGTITIAENSTIPVFNIASKSILFYYPEDPGKNAEFKEQFKQAISDCISLDRPDSVVLETITGRGSVYSVIHRQEMISRVDALISENRMNFHFFNSIYSAIHENKSKSFLSSLGSIIGKGSITVITTRFNSSALDLLLAEHYLEENDEFYTFIARISYIINSINGNLSEWNYENTKNVEKWFLESEFDLGQFFEMYEKQLAEIRKKLIDSI